MRRRYRSIAAFLAALSVAPVVAVADVDLELRNADTVKGTLDPGTETETFRIRVPAKAKLKLSAKGVKKTLVTSLVLRSPAGADVARANKLGLIPAYRAPKSGEYVAVVKSKNAAKKGDYSFTASWTSPRTFKPKRLTFTTGSADPKFRFAADAGARVRVTVKSTTAAVPQIVSIAGPNGDVAGADDGAGSKTEKTPSLKLPATGDYDVTVKDVSAGPAGGYATITVTVTPPAASKRKIDITASKTGGGGNGGAFARIVGTEGGTLEVPSGVAGLEAIEGTSITVDPGILTSGSVIVIASAPPLPLAEGTTMLGPAVFFGPEELKFGTDAAPGARISIPVDLTAVGGSQALVHVFTRTKAGQILEVEQSLLDFASAGFVSFPVSHFSSYVAATDPSQTAGTALTSIVVGAVPIRDVALSLVADGSNRQYLLADGTQVLRGIHFTGTGYEVQSYAGGGPLTPTTTVGVNRLQANFGAPVVAVTSTGDDVFLATATTVFRVDGASNLVFRYAGTGTSGDSGDAGPAVSAEFQVVADLMVDSGNDLWIVDTASARVRRIDASLNINTVAGVGSQGSNGDGNQADETELQDPSGIAERIGFTDMFICEKGRVRIVHVAGNTVETLVGDPDGATGCATGGETGTAARLDGLNSIASDFIAGRVIVGSDACDALYAIDTSTKVVSVRYGTPQTPGFQPDGPVTLPAPTRKPRIVATSGTFDIYVDYGDGPGNGILRSLAGLP